MDVSPESHCVVSILHVNCVIVIYLSHARSVFHNETQRRPATGHRAACRECRVTNPYFVDHARRGPGSTPRAFFAFHQRQSPVTRLDSLVRRATSPRLPTPRPSVERRPGRVVPGENSPLECEGLEIGGRDPLRHRRSRASPLRRVYDRGSCACSTRLCPE